MLQVSAEYVHLLACARNPLAQSHGERLPRLPLSPHAYTVLGRLSSLACLETWPALHQSIKSTSVKTAVKKAVNLAAMGAPLAHAAVLAAQVDVDAVALAAEQPSYLLEMAAHMEEHPNDACRYKNVEDPLHENSISRFHFVIKRERIAPAGGAAAAAAGGSSSAARALAARAAIASAASSAPSSAGASSASSAMSVSTSSNSTPPAAGAFLSFPPPPAAGGAAAAGGELYRYWVQDLGSLNGLYLNGEKLRPRVWQPLVEGARVRFAPLTRTARAYCLKFREMQNAARNVLAINDGGAAAAAPFRVALEARNNPLLHAVPLAGFPPLSDKDLHLEFSFTHRAAEEPSQLPAAPQPPVAAAAALPPAMPVPRPVAVAAPLPPPVPAAVPVPAFAASPAAAAAAHAAPAVSAAGRSVSDARRNEEELTRGSNMSRDSAPGALSTSLTAGLALPQRVPAAAAAAAAAAPGASAAAAADASRKRTSREPAEEKEPKRARTAAHSAPAAAAANAAPAQAAAGVVVAAAAAVAAAAVAASAAAAAAAVAVGAPAGPAAAVAPAAAASAPRRRVLAYNLFMSANRIRVVAEATARNDPERNVNRLVAAAWRACSEQEKAHFQQLAEEANRTGVIAPLSPALAAAAAAAAAAAPRQPAHAAPAVAAAAFASAPASASPPPAADVIMLDADDDMPVSRMRTAPAKTAAATPPAAASAVAAAAAPSTSPAAGTTAAAASSANADGASPATSPAPHVASMLDEFCCTICSDVIYKCVVLSCSHSYCQACIETWFKKKKLCPTCRTKHSGPARPVRSADNVIAQLVAVAFTPAEKAERAERIKLVDAEQKERALKEEARKQARSARAILRKAERSAAAAAAAGGGGVRARPSQRMVVLGDDDEDEDADPDYIDVDAADEFDYDDGFLAPDGEDEDEEGLDDDDDDDDEVQLLPELPRAQAPPRPPAVHAVDVCADRTTACRVCCSIIEAGSLRLRLSEPALPLARPQHFHLQCFVHQQPPYARNRLRFEQLQGVDALSDEARMLARSVVR